MMASPSELGNIELVGVTKHFGGGTAVDGVTVKVPPASYCCLLGPSACGKTTPLRLIAGHEPASEGDILISNRNVTEAPPAQRGTAMMFQNYALFPHLNCLDNVAFSQRMRGIAKSKRTKRAMELLSLVHMEQYAERMPSKLSGGQQQRQSPVCARRPEQQLGCLVLAPAAREPARRLMRAALQPHLLPRRWYPRRPRWYPRQHRPPTRSMTR